jgi:N-dimethylarginine dimethylaminohydrolase
MDPTTTAVTPEAALPWGADSEHGPLRDVLLCPPEYFEWRSTSVISDATLASGTPFDRAVAISQHRELVACYERHGVRCHFLTPDRHLPYQVFARDSSTATPAGGVVLAPRQPWRRGEAVAAARFYLEHGLPLAGAITAGCVEGGDVMIAEPGHVLIGCSELRTTEHGARQLAEIFAAQGWEARIQPMPARYVHLDVLVAVLGERLAAVCVEAVPAGLVSWLRARRFELIEVPESEALTLGVNAMPLGGDVVLSSAQATTLNASLQARGIEVLDPDLSAFTLGGGGAHCLAQALRRDPLAAR